MTINRNKKIVFIYQELSPFIKQDLDILQSAYTVRAVQFKNVFSMWPLVKGIWWADFSFSWFGKMHSLYGVVLSKMLHKKIIIVAGGDDVAKRTLYNRPYGIFGHPIKKWVGKFIFKIKRVIKGR